MLKEIDRYLDFLSSEFRMNAIVYFGRSLMALSLILTLLFNPSEVLFGVSLDSMEKNWSALNFFSLFHHFTGYSFTKILAISSLILVLVGWRPRYTCLLHFWIIKTFCLTCSVVEGGDQLHANLAMIFIPVCLMDNRKWCWIPNPVETKNGLLLKFRNITSWFMLHMMRLQIAGLYFNAAVGKLPSEEWANGNAVYYWFWHPYLGAPDFMRSFFGDLFRNDFFILLINHGTLVLEIFLFASIIGHKPSRKILFIFALIFHISIFFVHGLFSFMITMFGALIVFQCYDLNTEFMKLINRMLPLKRKISHWPN
jgi:antimicrobial peptide system SdpB family protein